MLLLLVTMNFYVLQFSMYIIVLGTLQVMFSFCTGSTTGSYLELRATNFHKRLIPGSLVFIY